MFTSSKSCVGEQCSTAQQPHRVGMGGFVGVGCRYGEGERGPVQNACSGVGLNEGLTQLVATAVEEKLINLPFISRLSKHGFARHHGCAWFLN